ncbi:hypothetical protein FH972_018816 [Carpinus fangiana]|uniref:TF-B3 domain-containing protein n=1 Tax=Carpinus fangiana TaxID=176857 RepID=A0A5N6RPP0_9ROSI|nr:hypothetical protein FH972_018816 [Carpinus fangiana]
MEPAPAQLPVAIHNALRDRGFTEPIFFAQKILNQRDLNRNHDRLLIEVVANNPIITAPEGIGGNWDLGVTLMHSLGSNPITLRRYPEGGALSYMLVKGWKEVLNQINPRLRVNQRVRLWSCQIPGNVMFYVFVEVPDH